MDVLAIRSSLNKLGVTVRGTQSPWIATLGDMTTEKTFQLAYYPQQSGQGNFATYPKPGVDIISKYQHFKGVEIDDADINPSCLYM